jgi:hypothetical protein
MEEERNSTLMVLMSDASIKTLRNDALKHHN